jgi:hypothetical protein
MLVQSIMRVAKGGEQRTIATRSEDFLKSSVNKYVL